MEATVDPAVSREPAGTQVLGELGEAVLLRVDEVAERMIEEILESDPAYRELVPGDDLRSSCRMNAAQLLRKLTRAGSSTHDYRAFLSDLGRRRVLQGLPLDSLLHAYRIGARIVWSSLVVEARRDEDRLDALASAATLLWELHDSSSSRISAAYRAAELSLARRTRERRFALVDALLAGRGSDGTIRWQASSALGLGHDAPLAVVICEADEDPAALSVALERCLAGHAMRSVWRPLLGRVIGIVQPDGAHLRRLARVLEPVVDGRVGISPVVGDLAELPRARQLAEISLATIPAGAREVAVLEGRLPAALLVAAPDVAALLIDHSLAAILALEAPERADLLEVIESYLANGGSVTETADALHYHRNTVLKRVRRVRAVTGRDLADPDDALTFALAVKALRLVGT